MKANLPKIPKTKRKISKAETEMEDPDYDNEDTEGTEDTKSNNNGLRLDVNDDSHVQSTNKILENISLGELERYIVELEDMHRVRLSRSMTIKVLGSSKVQTKLIEAIMQNTAFRSRVVKIKMQCFKVFKLLEDQYNSMKIYLKIEYGEQLNSQFRTAADKNTAVDFSLENLRRYMQKYQAVISLCDTLINDIDQSGWSIKSIIDVLNINVRKEFGL